MIRWPLVGIVMALGLPAAAWAQADEPRCREYTRELRVGADQADLVGMMCQQPDGTWKIMDTQSESAGRRTTLEAGPSGLSGGEEQYRQRSNTRIYSTHPDAPVDLVIEDNIPAYIVVDPYRWQRNYYPRDWSQNKRRFHYHHGGRAGWDKHWQHHERVLNKR